MAKVAKLHWTMGGGFGTPCAFFQQVIACREVTTDRQAVTCKKCIAWLAARPVESEAVQQKAEAKTRTSQETTK